MPANRLGGAHTHLDIRTLAEGELGELFALRQVCFNDRIDFSDQAVLGYHLRRMPYTYGCFLDGKLTSAAVCYPFEMFIAGRRARVGGIAGVLSAPEMRRRGFVQALLLDILRRLHEDGVGWALEYPFDPRFYARYGFATVPTGGEFAIPAETLFSGAAPDAERVTESAADSLRALYHSWAQHYSLTLTRDASVRPSWDRLLGGHRFCYRLEDAYAVMGLEVADKTQTLTVHDYAHTSPAGREALFRLIGSFHGQADLIRLHLPSDEPLSFDMRRHHTNRLPALQARITDLGAALGPLVSPREASFTLQVRDPFCNWNNGSFRVSVGPLGSTVTPCTGTPGLRLSIDALALLVTGALGAAAVLQAGLAAGEMSVARSLAALSGGRVTFMPRADFF